MFGATALSSYGGFWLAYAVIHIPAFNVTASYGDNVQELKTALAFFLFGWFIFTFLMLIATLRHSVVFIFLFFVLDMAFLFLAISDYTGNAACGKAGGYFGASTLGLAYVTLPTNLYTSQASSLPLPRGTLLLPRF